MKLPGFAYTLRFKLVVTSLIIQVVFVTVLVINSTGLLQDSLLDQSRLRLTELSQLLSTSLGPPLVQEDIELINEILESNINSSGITHAVLFDQDNQIVASVNWTVHHALPLEVDDIQVSIENGDEHHDTRTDIKVAGIQYGTLNFGVSLDFLGQAKAMLLQKSILISVVGILLSLSAMFFSVLWLTRHLSRLAEANELFAQGELRAPVRVRSRDEVGYLTESFNAMVESLDAKIFNLHQSKKEQGRLLETTEGVKARLTSLLEVLTRGILFETLDHRVVYYNPAFLKIWKMDERSIPENTSIYKVKKNLENIVKNEFHGTIFRNEGCYKDSDKPEFKTLDGRTVKQLCYPVHDESKNILGRLWVFEDITAQKRTAEQLIYLAEHDFLTGVFNRAKFQEELESQIAVTARNGNTLALVFFDIDDFKYINDVYGHESGDKILQQVATEISRLIRRDEMFCRLGGDEFAVLLPKGNEASASHLAERILKAVSSISLDIKNNKVGVTSSIGISIYPDHAKDVGGLLACADVAMYQSKDAGKNTWDIYEKGHSLSERMISRVDWVNRIDRAFRDDLFELEFQGVYGCDSRKLFYYEALIRMKDSKEYKKIYAPSQFISIAERSGKILEIDHWVVRQSIKFLAENTQIPCVAINVSGCSFNDDGLSELIIYELEDKNVLPGRLMLEITETAMVADIGIAQNFIDIVRSYGCSVCIDDFGAGYSSFIYLKHLNVDVIKIDGMFTHDLPGDKKNQVFVRAIVEIARGLEKKTVAEFVEDEETLLMLGEFGVDFVQGYYLQEPQPVAAII